LCDIFVLEGGFLMKGPSMIGSEPRRPSVFAVGLGSILTALFMVLASELGYSPSSPLGYTLLALLISLIMLTATGVMDNTKRWAYRDFFLGVCLAFLFEALLHIPKL